jgi:(2Fe-2S) ferredoxin
MPRYQRHIFVCTNVRPPDDPQGCCAAKGSEAIRSAFKAELKRRRLKTIVRANKSGCLDACGFGVSVVVYPEGVWYGGVKLEDVNEIIDSHILRGEVVERLLNRSFPPGPLRLRPLEIPPEPPPGSPAGKPPDGMK